MTISTRTAIILCLLAVLAGFLPAQAACPDCGLTEALAGQDSWNTCRCADWNLPWAKSSFLPHGGSPESLPPWPVGRCDEGECESDFWLWSGVPCDPWMRRWTVRADALFLQRSGGVGAQDILFIPSPPPTPNVVALNTADLGAGGSLIGPRVSITRHFTPDYGLEIGYFGFEGGSGAAVRDGNPNILFPWGALISTQFTVNYESAFHSGEVNVHHRYFRRLDLLAGLRWIEFQDGLHVTGPNPLPAADLLYDSDVSASLYGFQIGADAILLDWGTRWRVDSLLKAGVFANSSSQETTIVGNLGNVLQAGSSKDHTAFVGEIGLTGIYHISDHVDARFGYQVMWIEGVSTAGDQLLGAPGLNPTVHDSVGGLLFHGAQVGFEAWW